MSLVHRCRHYADRAGIWLSGLCLLHCLLTPFFLLGLPALSFWKFGESLHQVLAIILPTVALAAFVPGYRRHHRLDLVLLAFSGLVLIVSAAFLENRLNRTTEALVTIAGSLLLVRAHWLNQRLHDCAVDDSR